MSVCAACAQSTAGSLQSLCWASAAMGGVASAYFSGSLVESWGPRGVFALTAVFPLIVSAAAVLISEQPVGGPKFRADRAYVGAFMLASSSLSVDGWILVKTFVRLHAAWVAQAHASVSVWFQ
jgi:hypothetical protein